ncbi:uncharacterized protein LOC141909803 isoform X2 [Tubulanus polymorphus]|uniref:uncharacterized protein LOC141909803 isoform X2 n=1 Tax=Tubulanus polymorphus TaxID=672921 RepID=UPI003DA25252
MAECLGVDLDASSDISGIEPFDVSDEDDSDKEQGRQKKVGSETPILGTPVETDGLRLNNQYPANKLTGAAVKESERIRVGFAYVRKFPPRCMGVINVAENTQAQKQICGLHDIPPTCPYGSGDLVVEIHGNGYGYFFYTHEFQEFLPSCPIIGEIDTIRRVEALRLKYGGALPIGPWPMEEVKEHAKSIIPLFMEKKAIGLKPSLNIGLHFLAWKYDSISFEEQWNIHVDQLKKLKQQQDIEENVSVKRVDVTTTLSRRKSNRRRVVSVLKSDVSEKNQDSSSVIAPDTATVLCKKVDSGYECSVCGRIFGNKSNFNRHSRIHCKELKFSCEICGKSFTDKSNLNVHVKRHVPKGQYACNICGLRFMSRGNLTDHKKRHTSEKVVIADRCILPYCKKYGEKFKDLLQHARQMHKLDTICAYNEAVKKSIDKKLGSSSTTTNCHCPNHDIWIYRWVGSNHNCYLCECPMKFTRIFHEEKKAHIWTRTCRYSSHLF